MTTGGETERVGRRALICTSVARFDILASPSFAARLSLLAGPGAVRADS